MNERERARLVGTCSSAMSHGEQSLEQVPILLHRILKEEVWRDFETQLGKKIHHDRFIDFVTTAPPAGLGSTIEHIANFIKGNKEAEDLLDRVRQNPVGRPAKNEITVSDNTEIGLIEPNLNAERKRDRSGRTLRRLRKDFPELHAQVISNEKTLHAAAVEAKIYPVYVSVNLDDPKSAAATLFAKASPAFIEELRKLLKLLD